MSAPYRIRRSDRARRIRVSVDGNGEIEVVLPARSPERHAEQAVRELAPWIARRRQAVAAAAREVGRAPGTVPYLGERLTLVPERGRASRDALQAMGYDVQWHEYPMAHSVCLEEIQDLNAWLLKVLAKA